MALCVCTHTHIHSWSSRNTPCLTFWLLQQNSMIKATYERMHLTGLNGFRNLSPCCQNQGRVTRAAKSSHLEAEHKLKRLRVLSNLSPYPVTYLFQYGHTSQFSSNSFTNCGPSIPIHESMGTIPSGRNSILWRIELIACSHECANLLLQFCMHLLCWDLNSN